MTKRLLLILVLCAPAAAQTLILSTPTSYLPKGGYQTVTAYVTGVNNKTVTWSTSGGTLVGTNPCVVNEPCTIALHDTTAETDTLTATSNANGSVTASATITFTASPTPVSTWPRFFLTQANLASLQAKATSGNTIYQDIKSTAAAYYSNDNGVWSWSCGGGTGGSTGQPAVTSSVSTSAISISSGVVTLTTTAASSYTTGLGWYSGPSFPASGGGFYFYISGSTSTTVTGTTTAANMSATEAGTVGLSGTEYANNEYDALWFSFMELMGDTSENWACYAHDTAVYTFKTLPIYAPNLDWSGTAYCFALLGDWLRGSGAVTSSGDLATMRTFYSYYAQIVFTGAGNAPNPANGYNSPGMFHGYVTGGTVYPQGEEDMYNFRAVSGNNYNLSRFLILAAVGLTFNDNSTDAPDIPTGPYNTCGATRYQVCPDGSAGSLRAYWNYFDGALLYDYWAHIDDPNVVQQAYNAAYSNLSTLPTCEGQDGNQHPCFGDGRDGGSAEGVYYQYSMFRARWALNLIHTAGMDDPTIAGPQVSAVSSGWWDMKYIHDLAFLTGPTNESWNSTFGEFQTRPAYNPFTMGDEDNYFRTVSDAAAEAATMTYDSETGRTDRYNALRWINLNLAYGGPLGTAGGCSDHCGFLDNIANDIGNQNQIDLFISLPAGNPVSGTLPTDPRSALPTELFDGSFNQNAVLRTSWSATNSTALIYWFNDSLNNHEYNYDGRFDVYSCGSTACDYITKGRAIFNDYNFYMPAALEQNELGIQNSTGSCAGTFPAGGSCNYYQMIQTAGQFQQDTWANFVSMNHSELPAYAAAIGNTTNAYNGAGTIYYYAAYNDVTSASRSILYLKGTNQVVYYDRAAVGHAASTQSLQQIATGTPTISGNTATWTTQSTTQKGAFTTLLPASATLTSAFPCPNCNASWQQQDWEPQAILTVTPSGTPTTTQWLSALQWGASGFTPATATLVQSTAGQGFDGALLGSTCVMFERAWPVTFISTTYPASGCTTHYVSDLAPNTSYAISGTGAPSSATTDTAGVLTFAAAGSGNITVGSSSGGTTSVSGSVIWTGREAIP